MDDASVLRHLHSARHSQGGARRIALRRMDQYGDRDWLCHSRLPRSRVPDRAARRRLVFADLPIARPGLGELARPVVADADRRLFLAPRAADVRHGAVGLRHHDLPHQELVPGGDQEAICDHGAGQGARRESGAVRACVSQRHADRHRRLSRRVHRLFLRRLAPDRDHLLTRRARSAWLRVRW